MKRRVWFKTCVTFEAESKAALEHAIKSYTQDKSPECFGCNVDLGSYEWKEGRTVMVQRDGDKSG